MALPPDDRADDEAARYDSRVTVAEGDSPGTEP